MKGAKAWGALQNYWSPLRSSFHVKYFLANAASGLLPDFISGIIRARLYRLAGFDIGQAAFIMGNLELLSNQPGFYERLTMGAHASVGNHVTISLDAAVHLGNNVSIGPYVLIYTGTHQIGPGSQRRMGEVMGRPVSIEDGTWIGLGAIILPGVTIGRGCIVGAGAVVTESIAPNMYAEGNPARVVRPLPWSDR